MASRLSSLDEKLELLIEAACDEASPGEERLVRRLDLSDAIYHAAAGGRRVPILKVLLSNACQNDCAYCAIRASASVPRCTLRPEELAAAFASMVQRGQVRGLFLSSGLCGDARRTMDKLLATAELVRKRYLSRGYVHLKLLPGATADQVEQAARLADRISVNLEAPSPDRLASIAPQKDLGALLSLLEEAARLSRAGKGLAPAGPTTQFVAGAAHEPDRELLQAADMLYRKLRLERVYYSGFRPVPGTPLAQAPALPEWRQQRLYEADFLLRDYGFRWDELPFDEEGNLPRAADPKLAWALAHRELFPLELNKATRAQLLRVPGIGPRSAERILRLRRHSPLRDVSQLQACGIRVERCAPFVLLDGRRPSAQLPLFAPDA